MNDTTNAVITFSMTLFVVVMMTKMASGLLADNATGIKTDRSPMSYRRRRFSPVFSINYSSMDVTRDNALRGRERRSSAILSSSTHVLHGS